MLLHLLCLQEYGWFRDELYYVACGRHLELGYVDHPPLVAFIARMAQTVSPGLGVLRLPAVLAGAATIVAAGGLAREMGGGRVAQMLAALAVAVAPTYLFAFHIYSMNCFDILFWTVAAWVVARIGTSGDGRLWLLFGAVAGLGLENKHSLLFFGFGVFAGLLLTPERRHFRAPWIWLGGLLALLLFLPHLLWQQAHGWPTLEFIRNATEQKNVHLSPVRFEVEQIFQVHPVTLVIWAPGLLWLLASRSGRPFRALGWMYLTVLAVLLTTASKAYYLAPAYPPLFAAGGVAVERWLCRRGGGKPSPAWTAVLFLLMAAGGALTMPLALPILPVETYLHYAEALHLRPSSGERHQLGALPQHYADMHGWPEIVAQLVRVYRSLPEAEQRTTRVFARNYGEAGAVGVLGTAWGLPEALSGHNSYFYWGPPADGTTLLVIGGEEQDVRKSCPSHQSAGRLHCGLCMPYENDRPLWICRGADIRALWPRARHFG